MVAPDMRQQPGFGASDQHLAGSCKETVDAPLQLRIGHVQRSLTIRAWQAGRGAEQSADQGTLTVDLASVCTQVWAAKLRQRRCMLRFAPGRESCRLFRGGRNRPAAVVATRLACEGRNVPAEKSDFLAVCRHWTVSPGCLNGRLTRTASYHDAEIMPHSNKHTTHSKPEEIRGPL
ncbi:hypothetical protein GALL_294470 [mine drainage metagenome]|uniref:Uncharacterized protein n=1 Tax=mine drainage metagenome TaxID=410659 RepID=A0A1J5QYI6_9ZZZZ